MRTILNNTWQSTIDAQQLHYTKTTADPVATCQFDLVDNTSSISIQKWQEVLVLDEKVIPNPTLNMLVNPTFAPYNSNWTVNTPTGIVYTQINQSVATITFYLASQASAVYPGGTSDQLYSLAGTPTVTSAASVIGNNITGWGEITSQGAAVWAAASTMPAPTGHGWLYDSSILQGETMQAGAYVPTFRFNASQGAAVAGTLSGDLVCRISKWNSVTNTFSTIATSTLAGQTITTAATFSFPQGYGAAVAFDVGEYGYVDLFFNCKTNANGASNQGIRVNNLSTDTVGGTGDVLAQIVTPGAIIPSSVAIAINNAAVAIDALFLNFAGGTPVVPGQSYMLSGYFAWGAPDAHVGGYLQMDWYDAAQTLISNNFYFGPKPGLTPLTRYSVSGVAPASAVYVKASFGVQMTNATNSASVTLSNVQLEPMWFSDYTYPLPFAGPNQPNCNQFGNSLLWYRQKRKFGGLVNHAFYKGYLGNKRTIQVSAVGFAAILQTTNVNDTFTGQYDSAIIGSLLSTYYGNLFDATNVVQGVNISNLFCNWDDLRTIFDGLAAQSASYWTADDYWAVIYQTPGYTAMPYALICDNSLQPNMSTTFPAFNFQREMDYTQPGSNILVIGGTPAGTTLTTALTNGSMYTSLSVVALTEALPANMICSLSGTQGITLSSAAAISDTTLHIFSFTALTDYAKGSSITPQPLTARILDPAVIQTTLQNVYYSQGLVTSLLMRKLNDSTLQSLSDVQQRGLAELLQYDTERYIYHLTANVELLAGQAIPVTSNTDNLNATTLLIQSVTATWMGVDETMTDTWEYQADLGSVNRGATNIMSHIFRRTNSNSSAPAIIATSLVALERIGIVDGPPLAYAQLVLAGSPFAYFRLGETTGAIAYDYSLNGGNGSIIGGVTQGVAGLIYLDPNAAMTFDGSTGEISTATTTTNYATTALSVTCWFVLTTQTFGGCALVADSNSNIDNKGFQLLVKANGAGVEFDLGNIGGLSIINSTTALTAGKTYMLSGTYDGATMKVYLNSVLVGSTAATGSLVTSTHPVAIGYNPATSSAFCPATIDEVSMNTTALSAATELALYNIGIRGRA